MKQYDITAQTAADLEQERKDAIAEKNDDLAWERAEEMSKDYKLVYSALNAVMQDEKLLERICNAYMARKPLSIGHHVAAAISNDLHQDALKEIESEQNI